MAMVLSLKPFRSLSLWLRRIGATQSFGTSELLNRF
jgi:hypothetical protein